MSLYRIPKTQQYVDLSAIIGIGGVYHETRKHYRDDWWYFNIYLSGGSVLRVDAKCRLGEIKSELIEALEELCD